MTLARKWEQRYYAALAQAANQPTTTSLAEAEALATEAIAFIDQKVFLAAVAEGTVDTLAQLGLRADAKEVVKLFSRDLGAVETRRLRFRASRALRRELRGRRRLRS
jgi:hypothetical protein